MDLILNLTSTGPLDRDDTAAHSTAGGGGAAPPRLSNILKLRVVGFLFLFLH